MFEQLCSVMIVDDSPSDIQLLLTNLQDEFKLSVAKTGEKALELLEEVDPVVVLMDVEMPGMGGHEACTKIKESEHGGLIEVIFVSANDTLDEKVRGYDAGAADYLIKPVEPDELLRKVKFAVQRRSLEYERKNARETAMLAMTDSGEQGLILDFLRKSFGISTVQELAELVVATVARFGLACCVQVREGDVKLSASNTPPVLPLEEELMEQLAESGRIHQKQKRLIINYSNISMLVKNMPEDENYAGRLRDHLMLIVEAASNHLVGLHLTESFYELIKQSNQVLEQIKDEQAAVKERNVQILDQMLLAVEHRFSTVGLTDEQEEELLGIITNSVELSLQNFEQGLHLDAKMEQIAKEIEAVVEQHQQGPNSL